eukprot:723184-Pelagomonas_calceolata.AAC.1
MREDFLPVLVNLLGNVLHEILSGFVCGLMQRIACPLDAVPSGWWEGLYPVRKLFRVEVCRFEEADMENVMALHGGRK